MKASRTGLRIFFLGTFLGIAALAPAAAPNILLITADNLGYGDLVTYNPSSGIRSPSLDRLAREGARLTRFYTASPTCTVSRACLLTGRVPGRHGLTRQLAGVEGNYGQGLAASEVLIPQYLKQAPKPYATGCFGKWNIGFAPGSRPTERGFDEFIGHASGNIDYFRHNYRERHDLYRGTEEWHQEGVYSTDLFADAAIDFIRRHKGQPWFCYIPFNAPHFPSPGNRREGEPNIWQAPDEVFERLGMDPGEMDPRRRYEVVVHALDWAIGRILNALDKTDQTDSTFVFFMSDNGAFRLGRKGLDVGENQPLRGGGVTCWEGGLRVPAFARWPGRIPAGSVVDCPLWSPDLLTACLRLAELPRPMEPHLDGQDPLPCLMGESRSPHRFLTWRYLEHAAIQMGDWKLVREKTKHPWMLFDLNQDPSETTDLSTSFPQVVNRLSNLWDTQP